MAAVVLAVSLEWANLRAGTVDWTLAIVGLCVLLAPAALTWLGVGTLRELVSLPGRLKTGAAEAAERARAAVSESSRGSRVGGFVRALWAARALAQDVRGVASVGSAVRLVRLTRVPLLIVMTLGFLLNFVVIAAALVALVVVVV